MTIIYEMNVLSEELMFLFIIFGQIYIMIDQAPKLYLSYALSNIYSQFICTFNRKMIIIMSHQKKVDERKIEVYSHMVCKGLVPGLGETYGNKARYMA